MLHRTRLKFCGFTREADVTAAVAAGADAVGFVLYAPSPRAVTAARAGALAQALPPFVTPVLLFVNPTAAEVAAGLAAVPHALLQFHGDEDAAFCTQFARPYLKALAVRPGVDLLDLAARHASAQALLLDAPVAGFGGGGKVFDWSLLPPHVPAPVVLSGGLAAANVGDGIARLRPYAVDVSSGIEREGKGLKCARLMQQFAQAVRAADAQLALDGTPDHAA